ncbi:MAG: hypothetical protein QOD75_327 [Blastocatellia bacterium]|jgi:hypothetical protein|nr:hypothetical protein [Blastocatellia bacterium]
MCVFHSSQFTFIKRCSFEPGQGDFSAERFSVLGILSFRVAEAAGQKPVETGCGTAMRSAPGRKTAGLVTLGKAA